MDVSVLATIAGAVVALVSAVVGGVRWQVTQQQKIAQKIEESTDRKIDAIKSEIANLHSRINDVREQFVRRDDMMAHIDRIEKGLGAINGRLDLVFRPSAQAFEGR